MKSKAILLAAVVALSTSTARASSEGPLYKKLLDYVSAIFETRFWDVLDNYQAKTVTGDLNEGASQLYQAKDSLITDLKDNAVTQKDLVKRIDAINSQIVKLRTTIRRFGAEINKETNLSANDLIDSAGHELSAKESGIKGVKYLSPTNEKEKAIIIRALNEGMCRLKKVEVVSKCMLDSINAKGLACDKDKIKKDDCT